MRQVKDACVVCVILSNDATHNGDSSKVTHKQTPSAWNMHEHVQMAMETKCAVVTVNPGTVTLRMVENWLC